MNVVSTLVFGPINPSNGLRLCSVQINITYLLSDAFCFFLFLVFEICLLLVHSFGLVAL
uniref:Uncharacterized protein n=1 Tax=Arundo donax TaxID=35708 RepID=A0A0A9FNS3_ARUDO